MADKPMQRTSLKEKTEAFKRKAEQGPFHRDYVTAAGEEESGGDISSGEAAETLEPQNTGDNDKLPQTGQMWKPWRFVVIGVLAVIIGIGVFFAIRRKVGEQ